MNRPFFQAFAAALIACAATAAAAQSTQLTAGGDDPSATEGRPHDYDGPICREARARAESAAQVPGFTEQLERIISAVPECFEGWEPGDG